MVKEKKVADPQVLQAINHWFLEHGMAPTVEELRRVLNVGSTRTVLRYLRSLEENGLITRWPGARGLRPLKAMAHSIETQPVAIVGQAPAGPLTVTEQNIEGWVRLPNDFLRPATSKFFLLRVRGDSMNQASVEGERIEDKDLVLIRQQSSADPGSIVVALVDGEVTIKCLLHGLGYYVLKPISSNPKHSPIIVDKDFTIQGVVCRVLKQGSELLNVESSLND